MIFIRYYCRYPCLPEHILNNNIEGLIQKILVSLYAIPYDLPQGVKVGEGQSHGTCNEPPIEDPTYMSYFSGHEGNDQGGSGQGRGHGSSGEGTASTGDLAHADLGEPGLNDWADVWGEYLEGGSGQSCAGGNRNGCCGSGLRYQIAAGNGKGESSWDVLLGVTWDVMKTLGNVGVCAAVVIDDGFSA